ncbi:hypothetical protein BJV78DRAFT_1255198 [Lactifluus subvellereus]|nr:hypothetical protein BJV78DRAFT_1255198 [Lactifluus subvellereus]
MLVITLPFFSSLLAGPTAMRVFALWRHGRFSYLLALLLVVVFRLGLSSLPRYIYIPKGFLIDF